MQTEQEQETEDAIEIAFDFEDEEGDMLPPEPVTMIELAAIKRDRERLAELRADLGAMALELHQREKKVIERIEAGASVDGGAMVVHRRRQNISWLTVVAKELGHETVERIKNAWPLVFWKELQIA